VRVAALLAGAALVAACGGGSSGATKRHPPDLAAFLRLPVATPTACAGAVSGSTAGRRSPWVGTVDVSVFLSPSLPRPRIAAIRAEIAALPSVHTVYFESAADAYAEFQRLYTCSADVPRSAVPASYRLVLDPVARPARDALVAKLEALPGVASVACDPSSPCTAIRPAK
jgi:cell division protein FtsX